MADSNIGSEVVSASNDTATLHWSLWYEKVTVPSIVFFCLSDTFPSPTHVAIGFALDVGTVTPPLILVTVILENIFP